LVAFLPELEVMGDDLHQQFLSKIRDLYDKMHDRLLGPSDSE
jgi:hypothetical protein